LLLRRKRLACVRSETSRDCGPAALATVVRHYGRDISLLKLLYLTRADRQGSELQALSTAATRVGFESAAGSLPLDKLGAVALPLIAHLNQGPRGHFVVVYRVSSRAITVADPAEGLRRIDRSTFLRDWTGHVLLLRPTKQFHLRNSRSWPFVELLNRARKHRSLLLMAGWLAVVSALLAYSLSFFVRTLIDRVIPQADLTGLEVLAIALCVVAGVRVVFEALRQLLLAHVGARLSLDLSSQFVRHLLSLPASFFDIQQGGDLLTRFLDAPRVAGAVSGPILTATLDSALLVGCGAVLFVYSARLALLTICFVPLMVGASMLAVPTIRRHERMIRKSFGELAALFGEIVQYVKIFKSNGAEGRACNRLDDAMQRMQKDVLSRGRVAVVVGLVGGTLTAACSISLLWIGAREVVANELSLGQLMFFNSVLAMFLASVDRLVPAISLTQEAVIGFDRLRDIVSVPSEHDGALYRPKTSSRHRVELRRVTFAYLGTRAALSDIDLTIETGEMVAILGETGSGKSTLLSLVNGLYEPQVGVVLFDGGSVSDLDKAALRLDVSVVTQELGIIAGTIRDNLLLGSPHASKSELHAAAKMACATEFIERLPNAFDYEVGTGGTGLSSGQLQRLAIARALLRKSAVLLLDEATSHLDTETEAKVMDALQSEARCRIIVASTHRITVASRADRIVVLDQGRILETGNHEELIYRDGKYAALWSSYVRASTSRTPGARPHRSREAAV
jgi:ABC-type bacteriocin/lantibiotic exporter with double-glycine peptidase domain